MGEIPFSVLTTLRLTQLKVDTFECLPTPNPTPTHNLTFTPVPIKTSIRNLTPTKAPTKKPTPTRTPTRKLTPTRTPTRKSTSTGTPTPTPITVSNNSDNKFLYEFPVSLRMKDLGIMSAEKVCGCGEGLYDRVLEFTWNWDGNLQENEYFELRIWKPDGPHWGAAPATKDKKVQLAIGVLSGHTEVSTNRGDLHDATRLCASVAIITTEPYVSLSSESTSTCWNYTYP